MSDQSVREIIIHGTTSNGKVFRPSDWAERLCGILSSFNKENRLAYHEWVHPILIDKVRCVAIDAKLEEINPSMFRFLMDFAADNDLRVMPAEDVMEKSEQAECILPPQNLEEAQRQSVEDIAVAEAVAEYREQQSTQSVLREILPAETATAFAALSVLRPMLTDINGFVEQVNKIQRAQGYRLLGIFEEGKANAVAVCGFREETNLVSGRHIHIDDFVTVPQSRKRGYASRLLAEVQRIADEAGIMQLHLDSNVSSERTVAHRVYFQHGFEINAYHFVRHSDSEFNRD
ncbi:MAG: GNAT family N-acetyltransferase [Alysiella sp.]|uniref:GNAT family N-acetyltransferase n=1 Tax=Alysiella sp. TaxID=1872483 RepID=UPI0026DABDD0|nr:GNAT family N-acetyltransferase [Alysiella sp.]MDO4432996.1 GNAT family N-acetyltransferase [Alysiella sp.]